MEELRRELRREGFARLRSRISHVRETKDPMADLTLLGAAYYRTATAAPNLYRAMFLDGPVDDADLDTGFDTFMYLVKAVARCLQHGRFPKAASTDPAELAVEVWALTHGLVSLQFANLLPAVEAVRHIESGTWSLFLAWGDEPQKRRTSADRARRRLAELDEE